MLLFGRGKALKNIEEGLRWTAAGTGTMPGPWKTSPEGMFVEVPVLDGTNEIRQYIDAIAAESAYVLGKAMPIWVHLRGPGVNSLPMFSLKAIIQAACPQARSIGLDINPAELEPGTIAGYRSIMVDRINFRVDGPCAGIEESIRRARALGAFTSVEVCFGGELAGRAFLQAVERALAAAPNQLSVSDERSHGAFGAEFLERAGEMCTVAGFRRVSIWAWAQADNCFDSLGNMLMGRSVNLGPGAAGFRPATYENPGLQHWLDTRLAGKFEVLRATGKPEHWLELAAGLYTMNLRRDALDCKMHRHAAALERMGVVDKRGRPADGGSMEFCHRAARAARQALLGGAERSEPAAQSPGMAMGAERRRG